MGLPIIKKIKNFYNPSQIIVFITDKCNLNCSFCCVHDLPVKRVGDIGIDSVNNLIKRIKVKSHFTLTGGEPFLHSDLKKVINILKIKAKSINIITNGWLTDKIIQLVDDVKFFLPLTVQVSIDGDQEVHDFIRGYGSYQKAINTIRGLLNLGEVRVYATSTLSEKNFHVINNTVRSLKKSLGRQYLSKNFEYKFSLCRGNGSPRQLEWLSTRLIPGSLLHQKKIKTQINILQGKGRDINCYAGLVLAVVYSNGEVSVCEDIKPYGNINDKNFEWRKKNPCRTFQKKKCIYPCALLNSL